MIDVTDEALVDGRRFERGLDGHATELSRGEREKSPGSLVVDQYVRTGSPPRPVEDDDGFVAYPWLLLSFTRS